MDNKDYIELCSKKHSGFYGYGKTEYKGLCSKVVVTCPDHGDFEQRAGFHLNGRKCRKCAAADRAKKRAAQRRDSFGKDCNQVHRGFYDYSKVNYINNSTKVCIICPDHGDFWQTPSNHLAGHGCPSCAIIKNGKRVYDRHRNKRPELIVRGLPEGVSAVPVGIGGEYSTVDTADYDLVSVHNWYKNSWGYVVNNTVGLLHRFLLGVDDPNIQVDHINHDKLNNTRQNLRLCSHSENNKNRPKRWGSSIYKGVSWSKINKNWVVHIRSDGHQMHIGTFEDEIEAARAYDEAAKKYHKEFACLNFPNE